MSTTIQPIPLAAQSASGAAPDAAASSVDKLANRDIFLQLLVAQIKNQDPLKPNDGIQFLSQLAQFSELEQLVAIRQQIGGLAQPPAATPAPSGSVTQS